MRGLCGETWRGGVDPRSAIFVDANWWKMLEKRGVHQQKICFLKHIFKLVGGLEHLDYFSIYWESIGNNDPNCYSLIFFRGVGQPPTSKGWLGLSCSFSLGGLRFRLRVRKSPDVLPFLSSLSLSCPFWQGFHQEEWCSAMILKVFNMCQPRNIRFYCAFMIAKLLNS